MPMLRTYMQEKGFLLLMCLFLFSCKLNNEKVADPAKSVIQERIEEDFQNGLSESKPLELDLPNLPKTKYHSDKDHSSIAFKTGHWEIVNLIGWFEDFQIVMYADEPDFSDAVIFGKVDPGSIKMPNLKMASSVIQAPYIDVERYGEVSFLSSAMKETGQNTYELKGDFKMNGIEKEMVFEVRFNGFAYPGEKSICGFEVSGEINRHDFNIGGNDMLHSNKEVHADIIYLNMSLRME